MKKSILLSLIVLVPLLAIGQNSVVDKLFKKYGGQDGFTTITINQGLLKMISQLDENDEDMQALAGIKTIKILAVEDDAKVKDKPVFKDIAREFLEFIEGATLVIHNASFDLGFIVNELHLNGFDSIKHMPVIDTLAFARKKHPHQRNNLDALCDRYGIERGHRELHGALLDSELLAEVYLAMTGGRQFSLSMDIPSQPASKFVQLPKHSSGRAEQAETACLMKRKALPIHADEHAAHQTMMARIHKESEGQSIWHHPEAA